MPYDPHTFASGQIITIDRINSLHAFDLTDANLATSANISWAKVNKTGSSLAHLTTRSASDLNSGTLPNAVFPAILPAASGINLTNLDASNIASGTISENRLPTISWSKINKTGSNLTDLATRNITDLTGFPSQSTHGGKFLSTNGSSLSWQDASLFIPIGTVMALAYIPTSLPNGYLACDGSAVSRSAYASLFSIIGTTYGSGDLSTTFNLPDLRGVFLRGLDQGKGHDPSRVIGSYQADDLKSHSHTYIQPIGGSIPAGNTGYYGAMIGTANSSTSATGGTETRPKNVAIVYVIKF